MFPRVGRTQTAHGGVAILGEQLLSSIEDPTTGGVGLLVLVW
jgi:hypothetical protein